jgi:Trehalose utilisation
VFCKPGLALALSFLLGLPLLAQAAGKVLYVTHEPGRWHDYTAQLNAFRAVAQGSEWDLTVASGDKDALFEFLRSANFAAEQDVVVYNFCLANSQDIGAMENLIIQTTEGGIPAMLLHCGMHSWWDTFKKGKPIPGNPLGEARANKRLLKRWQKEDPEKTLPAWGDFTGVASTGHGPKKPIQLIALEPHPLSKDLPANYSTTPTELYNNHYITPEVQPLIRGRQGKDEAVVAWLAPRGASLLLGITLGHDSDEWQDPVFLKLLENGVNFLLGRE